MIEHLKQLYQNHIITDPATVSMPEHYVWYQTDEGPAGILKTALSDKEQTLLDVFLSPYAAHINLSPTERLWYDLLFRGKSADSIIDTQHLPFRLIHFYVKDPAIDTSSFSEAVSGLFSSNPVILWETANQGVLIASEAAIIDESIAYEDLVNTITSDFYTDFLLYAGGKQADIKDVPKRFRHEQSCFRICRNHFPAESVFRHEEQIPFLLLERSPQPLREELFAELLQEANEDRELLLSIREYLTCNMNITTAAKKLFIHRNSLQYRVDKFIEKTGLDVKEFPQAVTVYLALLEKHLSD